MARKAPVVTEVEDDEEVELEEVEDADEAPTQGKAEDDVWGVRALIAYLKEKTGTEYKPREVRTLLRKMAREDGTIDREIIAGNKSRYSWPDGPADPEIKAVLKAVKGGAIEASKKAALDKLKADKAKKTAAKTPAPAKTKAAAPPADEDDEDE
jgi:hypothetical protein